MKRPQGRRQSVLPWLLPLLLCLLSHAPNDNTAGVTPALPPPSTPPADTDVDAAGSADAPEPPLPAEAEASPSPEPLSFAPRPFAKTVPLAVLPAEKAERHLRTHMGEVLALLPGNFVNANAGRLAINSLSVRGSRSAQVVTLINGIPLQSPLGVGGGDPSKLSTAPFSGVELFRGAASAHYGNGAAAGALNLLIGPPTDAFSAVHAGYHGNDGLQCLLQFAAPLSSADSLSASGELVYNPVDVPIVGGDITDNAFLANAHLNFFHTENHFQLATVHLLEAFYTDERIGNRMQNFQSFHHLFWQWTPPPTLPSRRSLYNGSLTLRPIDTRYRPAAYPADHHTTYALHLNNYYQLQYEWKTHSLQFAGRLNLEGDFARSTAIAPGWLHREIVDPNASLQLQLATPKGRPVSIIELTGSLTTLTGDKNFFFPTGDLGILFFLDDRQRVSLKSSLSNGFRAPSISELYFATNGYEPNPKLSEEHLLSFDTALAADPLPGLSVGLLYFYRQEVNAIHWLNGTSRNLPPLHFHGSEAFLNLSGSIGRGIQLDWINHYTVTIGLDAKGNRYDLTHPHLFKSLLSIRLPRQLHLEGEVNVYSGFADIRPFCQMNIRAALEREGFTLTMGVDNLFNQTVRFHPYTTPLKRVVSVGVAIRNGKT